MTREQWGDPENVAQVGGEWAENESSRLDSVLFDIEGSIIVILFKNNAIVNAYC